MKFDMDHISTLISEVAESEILPRFQHLQDGDIMEKSPGDLVTIADLRAEEELTKRLLDVHPGTCVVGEEAASKDPETLKQLYGDAPVWIIDPIDGTRNFTQGNSVFGSMVCLANRGELLASWIHDPVRSRTAMAEKGGGAVLSGKPLHINKNISAFERMTVSLNYNHRRWLEDRAIEGRGPIPRMATRYGSVAHDYISLACGEFHAAQYRRLNPWDHAPGVLLFREAGGFDCMIASACPYRPVMYPQDCLLMAPSSELWEETRAFLNPGTDTFHV